METHVPAEQPFPRVKGWGKAGGQQLLSNFSEQRISQHRGTPEQQPGNPGVLPSGGDEATQGLQAVRNLRKQVQLH